MDTKAKIKIGAIGDVPAVGGRFSLSCTVEGGLETVLVPSSDASWLDSLECDGGELSFSVGPNKTDSEREADITVSGDGCEEAVLHIRQNKADFELFVDIGVFIVGRILSGQRHVFLLYGHSYGR